GFSLSNGVTRSTGEVIKEQSGGGVWCESISATISNCIFVNNSANQAGGGVYQGTLLSCTLSNNSSFIQGGGACLASLYNCLLNNNNVVQGSGVGGASVGFLIKCVLVV